MKANNSPRFVKRFMIGLVASSAGAFVALPGTAMPEPTAGEEMLPAANAIEDAVDTAEDAVEATDEAIEGAVGATDEAADNTGEAVADTEETVEDAVADTEATRTPEAEPVTEADALMETAPVADTEVTDTEDVVSEDVNTEAFTISELASSSESLTVLSAALNAAELSEVLSGEGPFTVFAPTDEAFADLPEGAVEQLLLPENKDVLIQVLTYHVVPGAMLSTDLETGNVETVEGSELSIDVAETVTINSANVVLADVSASNGVIHVIDRVILPPAPEADAEIDGVEAIQ